MKFENTVIENQPVDFERLTDILEDAGFVLAGQWDYERVTFDKKFEIKGDTYYLRLQGYAAEGDLGGRHAKVKLMTPLLGKHYYPHGVEYGEGENFPKSLIDQCKSLLVQVNTKIQSLIG